jgi:hypothetical protein
LSTAEAKVVSLRRKKLRSIEVFRRAEATAWEKAEAIYADLADRVDVEDSRSHGVNTGLGDAEDEVHSSLVAEGLDVSRSYLHQLYITRRAWPSEERIAQASFEAHYLLRSQTYDKNRKQALERLSRKSKTGKVTAHAVKVWISERKPPHQKTFLQLVEERVRGSVKGAASPWHLVTEEDRQAIAEIVIRIGREVADGTFPAKA